MVYITSLVDVGGVQRLVSGSRQNLAWLLRFLSFFVDAAPVNGNVSNVSSEEMGDKSSRV